MQIILNEHSSVSSYVGPPVSLNPRLGKLNPFLSKQWYSWFRGTCVLDKQAPRPYDHTKMAWHFPIFPSSLSSTLHAAYCTATSVMLLNGDVCRIGDWVLFSLPTDNIEAPALGRIHEIVVSSGGADAQQYPRPDAILLQQATIAEWAPYYRMPRVSISGNWAVISVSVSHQLTAFN